MDLVDIHEWASGEIFTIQVSPVHVVAPYTLKVRQFVPKEGDMLEAIWHVGGEKNTFPVPPYGIASMKSAADAIGIAVVDDSSFFLHDVPLSKNLSVFDRFFLQRTFNYASKYSAQVQVSQRHNITSYHLLYLTESQIRMNRRKHCYAKLPASGNFVISCLSHRRSWARKSLVCHKR